MRLTYRLNVKELWSYCGYKLRRNQYKTDYWSRMPIFLRITSGYYIVGYVLFFVVMQVYNNLAGYPAAKLESWVYNIAFALFWPLLFYVLIRFAPRYLYAFLVIREGGLKEQQLLLEKGYLRTTKQVFFLNRTVHVELKKGMLYLIYSMPCAQEEIVTIPMNAFESEQQKEEFLKLLKNEQEKAKIQAITAIDKPEVTVACNVGNDAAAHIMELSLFYQKLRKVENRLGDTIQILIWLLVSLSLPHFALLTGQMIWMVTWSFVVLFARELTSPKRAEKRYLRDIKRGCIPEILGEWKMQCGQEGILLKHQEIYDFYSWKDIFLLVDTDDEHVLCDKIGNMILALPKSIWKDAGNTFDFRALCVNYGVTLRNVHTDPRNRRNKNALAKLILYASGAVLMSAIVFGPTLAMIPSLIEKAEEVEEHRKWEQEKEPIDAGPKDDLVDEAITALKEQVKNLEKMEIKVPKTVQDNQEVFIQMSSSAAEGILNKPYVETLCQMGRVEDYGDGPQISDQLHWLDTQNDYYSGKNYGYVLLALEAMSGGKLEFKILEEVPYEKIRFLFVEAEYEFTAESAEVFDHQYLTLLNELLEAAGSKKHIYICREPENYFFQKGDLMFLRDAEWAEEFEAVTGFATEKP